MGKWLIAAELREKQNARGLKTSWLLGKDWLRESTFTRAIHHLHRSPNSVWARCQTWLGFKGLTQTKQTRKKLLEMPHCKFITLQREYNCLVDQDTPFGRAALNLPRAILRRSQIVHRRLLCLVRGRRVDRRSH